MVQKGIGFMKKFIAVFCLLAFCLSGCSFAETAEALESPLRVENGMMQPFAEVSDLRDPDYSNENSDILRFCVWVETDYDTDFDGSADRAACHRRLDRPAESRHGP